MANVLILKKSDYHLYSHLLNYQTLLLIFQIL